MDFTNIINTAGQAALQRGYASPPPPISTPLDASRVGSSAPVVVPSPVNNTAARDNLRVVTNQYLPTQAEAEQDNSNNLDLSNRQNILGRYVSLTKDLSNKGTDTATAQESVGLAEKREALNEINKRALRLEQSFRNEAEAIRTSKGGTVGGVTESLTSTQGRYERQRADIAIEKLAAQGDVDTALKLVDDQIKAKYEPIQNEIDSLKVLYQLTADDMTESEKMRAEAVIKEKQDAADFARQKELLDYRAKIEAQSGGTAPKIQNINGQDYQWDATNQQWVPATISGTDSDSTKTLQLANSKAQIDQISSLTGTGGSAVGTSFLTRAPSGFFGNVGAIASIVGIPSVLKGTYSKLSGKQQDFIASVEQLRSQLNLNSLINAKKQGATFGALSDQELQVLGNSATKLGSWAIKDSAGNVVGYNTSEANFRKELDKVGNFAKLDYLLKGGDPAEIGVTTLPDGRWAVKNSDGTVTLLK